MNDPPYPPYGGLRYIKGWVAGIPVACLLDHSVYVRGGSPTRVPRYRLLNVYVPMRERDVLVLLVRSEVAVLPVPRDFGP